MKISAGQLAIINLVLQIDNDGKAKQYALSELSVANEIFTEVKKNVKEDKFVDGEIDLTSEQKVFITKLIDERSWTVQDAEAVFDLKKLIK